MDYIINNPRVEMDSLLNNPLFFGLFDKSLNHANFFCVK